MAKEAVAQDIIDTYIESWKLGLKALAIYRDGSKRTQPLSMKNDDHDQKSTAAVVKQQYSVRRRLPDERKSITHKFTVAGHEGYITVGLYDDGKPGEVFITMAKEGSTISSLMEAIGVMMSVALQSGVPVDTIIRKFVHSRFEPAGFTENPDIPLAKSILDYIGKFLALNFLSPDDQASFGIYSHSKEAETVVAEPFKLKEQPKLSSPASVPAAYDRAKIFAYQDAPACRCGAIMIRTGSCYTCPSCGENLGSCS